MAKKTKLKAPPSSKGARDLGLAKLAESGLDAEDAKVLGLEFLGPSQTQALGHEPLPSLKIPYFTPDGKPQISWPKHPPFYRVRYFRTVQGFEAETDAKQMRYTQPSGGSVCAYFPQNQDWGPLMADGSQPIIFTEGELKAACACKYGFATIGLGGVQNWQSKPKGVEFLPELKAFPWVGRNVYVCFDSDFQSNKNVMAALEAFAFELMQQGAFPHVVALPEVAGKKKTGLDDFIVAEGAEAFAGVLHMAVPLGLTKPLFELNDKYTYVRDPGLIINNSTLARVAPKSFTDHLESTTRYQMAKLNSDGSVGYVPIAAPKAWLSWPLRSEAACVTYQPGKPRIIPGGNEFNVWPGWGLEPKKGDVKPFLELLDHLFTGAEPESKQWFLRWLAYPLQFPGTKMFSAAVFHGVQTGTGKTLIGRVMSFIYGKNYTLIGQDDLHASFNHWAECKQFAMGDDVTGANKREDNDRLKKLITQKEMWINTKFIPSYIVPDCLNYFFNSNHSDAFFMEDADRRLYIHEVLVGPKDRAFYRRFMDWLKVDRPGKVDEPEKGGAAHVFDYLLHLPMGDFDPAAPALKTAARARMIGTVQSDLGGWVRDLRDNPDFVLRFGEVPIRKDLFTNKELLGLYDAAGRTKVTAQGLGRALNDAGLRQVCHGQPVRLKDGSMDRYYAVRNVLQWARADYKTVQDHLEKAGPDAAKPKAQKKY